MNFSVLAPEGTNNHGDPTLICTIPKWTDYIVFFATNYLAHAATLVSLPGQNISESISCVLAALLLPSSGVLRVVKLLFTRPAMERDPLRRAARAGALCMVVAVENKSMRYPVAEQKEMWFPWISTSERATWWVGHLRRVPDTCCIHGFTHIPDGYAVVSVPANTPLRWRQPHLRPREHEEKMAPAQGFLASSYNVPKLLVSLIQSVWATVTLYQARGNQIDAYGYAAFGLTVAPYAFMSIVNIFANLVMPEYSALFMVHTPDLDKAITEGGKVDGVVAEVDTATLDGPLHLEPEHMSWYYSVTIFVFLLTPLILVAGLSGFSRGESTFMQRGFIMAWHVVSIVCGVIPYLYGRKNYNFWLISFWIFAAPAVGGMVMVGLEIRDYGVCRKIT